MAFREMIEQFTWNILDSNSWLLVEEQCGLLFDPVDSKSLYEAVDELSDLLVVLTHCHYDHICGLNKIREIKPEAHVLSTVECSRRICSSRGNLSNVANAFIAFHDHCDIVANLVEPFYCASADQVFEDSLNIEWCGHYLKLSEFNGHSKGSLCCEIDDSTLISGDTLLPLPTVTRLPGGSTKRFWEEDFPRLESMRGRIEKVFPGHGASGSLEEMLEVNKISKIRK